MARTATFLMLSALLGCGGPQRPDLPPEPLRKLDEGRAFQIILNAFSEMDVPVQRDRRLVTQAAGEFQVDFSARGAPVAVEYLDARDRDALRAALPRRQEDALRVMAAADASSPDREVQVLILEDRDYEFDPNPEQSGGGRAPTIQEVEGRLRRYVIDFLQYAKTERLLD